MIALGLRQRIARGSIQCESVKQSLKGSELTTPSEHIRKHRASDQKFLLSLLSDLTPRHLPGLSGEDEARFREARNLMGIDILY